MIKYLLLFLLPFSLYASKILSYNIYERTDRADVMITFDTPYVGNIKKSLSRAKIIIKLEDASIESSKIKKVNSKFLHSLSIISMKNQVRIIASVSPSTKLIASKTSDSYGLRLRFVANTPVQLKKTKTDILSNDLSALPTKKEVQISIKYYIVVGALVIGIIILLFLKKKIKFPTETKAKDSWLFKSTKEKEKETQTLNDVSIRFQKSINNTNSVVMLDFDKQSYLVLMGNNNILLDKFSENKPTSQDEFESILQSRHKELEKFLDKENKSSGNLDKEPLQAYKERAASLIYGDNA